MMCKMEHKDHFIANLGATLLQMKQVEDCEQAMIKMSQHIPELNMAEKDSRFVFVEKDQVWTKIDQGQIVKLEKYPYGY